MDPVTLRSALSAALASDPRLAIVTLPSGGAIEQTANEFDVVLASEAPVTSAVPVVLIHGCGRIVEVNGTMAPQTLPYAGLSWLADLLVACLAEDPTVADTSSAEEANSKAPDRAAGTGEVVAG